MKTKRTATYTLYLILILISFTYGCAEIKSVLTLMGIKLPPEKKQDPKSKSTTMTADKETAMKHFVEGSMLEVQQKYAEAILEYQTASQYAPYEASIHFILGKTYLKAKQNTEAISSFGTSVALDSTNEEAVETLASLYVEAKRYDEGKNQFERLTRLHPKNKNGYYNLGLVYSYLKQDDNAIDAFTKHIQNQGADTQAISKKFELLVNTKRYEEAIQSAKELLDIEKDSPDTYQVLGMLYERIGKYTEAEQSYLRAIKSTPLDLKIRIALIEFYGNREEWKKISVQTKAVVDSISMDKNQFLSFQIYFYEKVKRDSTTYKTFFQISDQIIKQKPQSASYLILTEYWANKKNLDSAFVYAKKCFQKYPDDIGAVETYIRILMAQKKTTDAEKIITINIPKFKPHEPMFLSLLGYIYYERGESEKCIKVLLDALKKGIAKLNDQVKAQNYSFIGLCYERLRQPRNSEKYYREALKIDTQNPTLLNNLAYSMAERDTCLEEGLEMVKTSLQLEPENSSFLDTKAWIYYKLKKYNEAKEWIQKAIRINDNSAVVYDHFGDIVFQLNDIENAKKAWQRALELGGDASIQTKINSITK